MAAPEDILTDNLREALREAHKRIVFGTGAALFLLLLAVQDWQSGSASQAITVPVVGVDADRTMAKIIAAVAYFIAGYLAYLAISRARRIKRRLDSSPKLREAALMYPSIPTIIHTGPRIWALSLPILIFLAATAPSLFMLEEVEHGFLLFFVILALSTPYVLLIIELRYPLSEVKYKLTEKSLKQLGQDGVRAAVLNKLGAIQDKEYLNRDLFQKALTAAVKKEQPTPEGGEPTAAAVGKVQPTLQEERLILAWACEEPGLED